VGVLLQNPMIGRGVLYKLIVFRRSRISKVYVALYYAWYYLCSWEVRIFDKKFCRRVFIYGVYYENFVYKMATV